MITIKRRASLGYQTDPLTGKSKQIKKVLSVEGKNKKDAELKFLLEVEKQKAELKRGSAIVTYRNLVSEYYRINNALKPRTMATDYQILNIINPTFASRKIADIQPDLVFDFLREAEKKGYSDSMLFNIYKTLNKHMNFAADNDIIEYNPLRKLKKTKYAQQPGPVTSSDTFDYVTEFFLRAFNDDSGKVTLKHKVMLLLIADGCLRTAELFGIVKNKINFDDKWVDISQNFYHLSKKEAKLIDCDQEGYTTTKTRGSTRRIPLSNITIEYIKRYIEECDSYLEKNRLLNSKGLLFYQVRNIPDRTRNHGPRKADAPLHEVKSSQGSLLNQMLRRMCLEYSLPIITAHEIRKWAFTYRFNLECDDKYCKYILGHGENRCDSTYLLTMFKLAKKQHVIWENDFNKIVLTQDSKTSDKTFAQNA